jgi:outer membrane immunogenic protein
MKKSILSLVALIAFSGIAVAADMPVKGVAPAYAPVVNWTGFYLGGHIGGAWSNTNATDPTGATFAPLGAGIDVNGSGFAGGGQLGYNWQTGSFVFGVQADMTWTGINASANDPFAPGLALNNKSDWLGTVTGRIGYAWNNVLFYGKGGAAWVHNNYSAVGLGFNATGSDTRTGWSLGTGLEYAFSPNWSTFIEYDYIGLGTRTVTLTDPVFGPFQAGLKQNVQLVKLGVNYKF